MMQEALAGGTDVSFFEAGADRVNLMRQNRHESLAERRVAPECRQHLAFRIDAHPRSNGGDGVTENSWCLRPPGGPPAGE
jgi:hypothetical protein